VTDCDVLSKCMSRWKCCQQAHANFLHQAPLLLIVFMQTSSAKKSYTPSGQEFHLLTIESESVEVLIGFFLVLCFESFVDPYREEVDDNREYAVDKSDRQCREHATTFRGEEEKFT